MALAKGRVAHGEVRCSQRCTKEFGQVTKTKRMMCGVRWTKTFPERPLWACLLIVSSAQLGSSLRSSRCSEA